MDIETKNLIANQVALELGGMIGRFMRACIIIAGLVGVCLIIAESGKATNPVEAKPAATAPAKVKAHKPTKSRQKKCHCDCKKVVDNASERNYKTFIGPRD